jgi:excisionase family DNA binding protein
MLNVSLSAIYKLSQRGVLPRHRIGRAVRFDVDELRAVTREVRATREASRDRISV